MKNHGKELMWKTLFFIFFFVFKVPCLLLNNFRIALLVNLAIVSRNPEAGKSSDG